MKREAVLFVVIVFAVTAAINTIQYFAFANQVVFFALVGVMMWTPGLVALARTPKGQRIAQLGLRRARWSTFAIAAAVPIGFVGVSVMLRLLSGGEFDWFTAEDALPHSVLMALVVPALLFVGRAMGLTVLGTLGEELGWRGYLQSRFQRVMRPVLAAILVALIWGYWHVGLAFLMPELWGQASSQWFGAFVWQPLGLIPLAMAMAWLYLRDGSVWPCALLHGINNATENLAFAQRHVVLHDGWVASHFDVLFESTRWALALVFALMIVARSSPPAR